MVEATAKRRGWGDLRSMLERLVRKGANSGSLRIFFHFPVPCFLTPALRALSSSDVHFCFWFPITAIKKLKFLYLLTCIHNFVLHIFR